MTATRIRLGMVGGGRGAMIGGVHRIASRIDDKYELVAGALSADPDRAKASAADLLIDPARAYTSYETMFAAEAARADGIEVVAIVTPNHMHFPVAKAALEAGINVICDKPLTRTLDEALALEKVAAQSAAFFALTHNYSGYPLVRQARDMVARGDLGKIRLVQVEYPQEWLTEAQGADNKQAAWRTDPARAGAAGCLGDIGTHAFQLLRFVSGLEVDSLSADLTTFVPGRAVDDNVNVMLRFAGGARGMLWASQVAAGCENGLRIRIFGDKAGLSWFQENPNELWLTPLAAPAQRLTRRADYLDSAVAVRGIRVPFGHPEGYLEAFATLYADVAAVLHAKREGKTVAIEDWIPGMATGVEGMKFISAVLASAAADSRWTQL